MIARVLLLILCASLPAMAQRDASERGAGASFAMPLEWSRIRSECVTPAPRPFATGGSAETCSVVSVQRLGSIADTSWFRLRYRRAVGAENSGTADSVSYDELVLASRVRSGSQGSVEWHVRRERSVELLDTLTWVRSPVGVVVEIRICLNGTGGCTSEYLHRLSDSWRGIRQPYVEMLKSQLPPGHRLHKGQRLNLRTMQGVWPLARDGDGNCCPSRQVSFRVQLRGDALELVSLGAIRPYQPPNAGRGGRAGR